MQMYFPESFKTSMSVGEIVLSDIEDILEHVQTNILLLDEWDANLDLINIKKISDLLEKTAQTKCILEVRHRSE